MSEAERLQAALAQAHAKTSAPGVAAEVRRGRDRWRLACGSVSPDASFYLYSITKTYIAAILLRLAERRPALVALDEPIRKWLGTLPFDSSITVRQLLHNTSGITDYCGLRAYGESLRAHPDRAWTFDRYVAESAQAGPRFPPGTNWDYSNTGFALLARLIETLTTTTLADAVRTEIATPLGLDRTHVIARTADAHSITPGFGAFPASSDPVVDIRPLYDPGWVAHGLVAAPADETATFYDALFQGRLLSAASIRELRSVVRVPVAYPPFVDPSYGLGLIADPAFPGGPVYGHGGSGPGYSTQALHWPDAPDPITVVVLYNADGVDAFLTAMALYEAVASNRPPVR